MTRMMRPPLRSLLALLALLLPAAALGQEMFFRGYGAAVRRELPRAGEAVDRGFTFCRLMYTSVRREPGGSGWRTDYPDADANFMTRFSELTAAPISRRDDGQPGFTVVEALDDQLFECPFLFASDVGTAAFLPEEAERLREYLLKGGFLWVDDFWGERAWAQWASEIQRVLPGRAIEEVTPDHPMLQALYAVPRVPQIANVRFWLQSGRRETSERGAESATPHLRAVFDDAGNPLVLMSFNTDIADGWEREAADQQFFHTFSPEAYALGINIAVWAMTH